MKVEYLAQPDTQLGRLLSNMLNDQPSPCRITLVSAFVSLQTIMRIKHQIIDLHAQGVIVRFVLGIDLGGTSREVLEELIDWNVEVHIVKHRIPRHTFHPKLFLFEWPDHAVLLLGSNNLTEGGLFSNYEATTRVTYTLPEDIEEFNYARDTLKRFLAPQGPVVYELTSDFLDRLVADHEIPSEADARLGRDIPIIRAGSYGKAGSAFGIEHISLPPPLPAELLDRLSRNIRRRRTSVSPDTRITTVSQDPSAESDAEGSTAESLFPAAFYMTLPKLQGDNIPGEARVPLSAIEIARDFWGWRDQYSRDIGTRASRVYWNWRPIWRISSVESPETITDQVVRMYLYEASSDFRFYARPLVNLGADSGDVIRLTRISEPNGAEYECVLARRGTSEYDEWIENCNVEVRQGGRRFGYA